ncbi:hypothetical protein GCM10023347_07290 [Streptomyces chumphonensis]
MIDISGILCSLRALFREIRQIGQVARNKALGSSPARTPVVPQTGVVLLTDPADQGGRGRQRLSSRSAAGCPSGTPATSDSTGCGQTLMMVTAVTIATAWET